MSIGKQALVKKYDEYRAIEGKERQAELEWLTWVVE